MNSEGTAPGIDPKSRHRLSLDLAYSPEGTRSLRRELGPRTALSCSHSDCVAVALRFTESLTLHAHGGAVWGQDTTLLRVAHTEPR